MIVYRRIMSAMHSMSVAGMHCDPKYITVHLGHNAYYELRQDREVYKFLGDPINIEGTQISGFNLVVGEVDLNEVMLRFEVKG